MEEKYRIIRKLCQATIGSVYFGERKSDGVKVAVKMIPKSDLSVESSHLIKQEAYMLNRIDHPNVIKLLDFFQDDSYFYLIFEYAPKGDLFDYVHSNTSGGRSRNHRHQGGNFKKPIKEKQLKKFVRQIVFALEYCYREHNIVHRDIKLENIFLFGQECKLGDFGFATYEGNRSTKLCGTLEYLSPEMIQGDEVTHKSDIWSLGVMLYECVCGQTPFKNVWSDEINSRILSGQIDWNRLHKYGVTQELLNLIYQMLKLNPVERIDYSDILNHVWFGTKTNDSYPGRIIIRRHSI